MDRRKFIKGVAASAVALPAVALGAKGFVETCRAEPTVKVTERRSQSTFLYVTRYGDDAERIYNILGRPRNLRCVGLGGQTCGYGADIIIVDDDWDVNTSPRKEINERWWNECIETRKYPGAREVHVKWWEPLAFNFNQECGIRGDFIEHGAEYSHQGIRFMKGAEKVTPDEFLQARAKLLKWYMLRNG